MNPRLALALLLPFAACGLQWLLWDAWIKPCAWFLFLPAAFFSAWLGGLRGGIAGTLLGALLAWYVFIPPAFSFSLDQPANAFSIGVFAFMGGLFAWFHEQLRRAQQRSEVRFEATFEQAAVGLALVTPDGRWLRVNRKLCAIVGYRPEELLDKTFQDITHPDDLNADLDQVRRMLAREIDSYALEKRYVRKDGGLVWIKLTVALVWRPDGAPDYFISVVEDISARKAAEAKLREQDLLLNEMSVLTHVGGWSFDPATGAGNWTAESARIHDLPEDAPIDVARGIDYYVGEHRRVIREAVRAAVELAQAYDLELEIRTAAGRRKWVRAIGHPVVEHGRVVSVQGSLQDITERRRIEAALRESEMKFRLLADNAVDCIFWIGPAGDYRYISPACATISGHAAEEFLADPDLMTRLIHPDDRAAYRAHLGSAQQADPGELEFRIVRKDGEVRWISHHCKPILGDDGEYLGRRGSNRDITERKHAEDELRRRNEELERFDRASVGRELRMIELKRRVNDLTRELGREPPYELGFTEARGSAARDP